MGLIFSDCRKSVCLASDNDTQIQQQSVTHQSSISCSYPSFHLLKSPESRRSFKTTSTDFSSLFMYMTEDQELTQFDLIANLKPKKSDSYFFFMFQLAIKNYQNYQSYMFYQCPTFIGLDTAFNVFKWEDLIGINFKLLTYQDHEIIKFMDPLQNLKILKLNFRNTPLNQQLLQFICKKIKDQSQLMSFELNISNCSQIKSLDLLGDTLLHKQNFENLALILENINLGEMFILDLQTSLKQMNQLRNIELNLSKCDIKVKSVIRIFHLLSFEIKSIKLNLSYNKNIDDDNIDMMMNFLPHFQELKNLHLNLSFTQIQSKSFGQILKKMVSIKSLHVLELVIRMHKSDILNQFVRQLSEGNRRSLTQVMNSQETFYLMDQLKMSTDFSTISKFTFKSENLFDLQKDFLEEISMIVGPQLKHLNLQIRNSEKMKDLDKLIRILGQAVNLKFLKLSLPNYNGLSERMKKIGIVEFSCDGQIESELIKNWDNLVKVNIKSDNKSMIKQVLKMLADKKYLLYYKMNWRDQMLDWQCQRRRKLNLLLENDMKQGLIEYLI